MRRYRRDRGFHQPARDKIVQAHTRHERGEDTKGRQHMGTRLLEEIQHGPAYAEGNGASLSIMIAGALLAMLGLFLRLTSRPS